MKLFFTIKLEWKFYVLKVSNFKFDSLVSLFEIKVGQKIILTIQLVENID